MACNSAPSALIRRRRASASESVAALSQASPCTPTIRPTSAGNTRSKNALPWSRPPRCRRQASTSEHPSRALQDARCKDRSTEAASADAGGA
eukprot:scaffold358_cov343-Pavlova_lutheri.AAC.54